MLKKLNDWMLETYVSKTEDARRHIRRYLQNERGAGAVEYGLVIAVIVVIVIMAATVMKDPLEAFFRKVVKTVTDLF